MFNVKIWKFGFSKIMNYYLFYHLTLSLTHPAARAPAHSPQPEPEPEVVIYFLGPDKGVETRFYDSTPMSGPKTRVFAILHLCPDPKKMWKRAFAILQLCPDEKLAILRFYTYVRAKRSRFCDCTFMSAHWRGIRSLGRNFHDLAKPGLLVSPGF